MEFVGQNFHIIHVNEIHRVCVEILGIQIMP